MSFLLDEDICGIKANLTYGDMAFLTMEDYINKVNGEYKEFGLSSALESDYNEPKTYRKQ